MAKNIKISDIGNRKTVIQRRTKNQGNKSTEITARTTAAFIRQANITNNSVAGSDRSANGAAKSYLLSFGCGIIEAEDISKSDYSLLRSLCRDEETIENPNIFDSDTYSNLRNQGIVATDKFPNTNDPFYKLDDGLSRIERERITNIRDKSGANFVQFAADLYEYSNSTKIVDSSGNVTSVKKPRSRLSSDLVSPGLLRGASQKPGQSASQTHAARTSNTTQRTSNTVQRQAVKTTRTRTTKNSSNY